MMDRSTDPLVLLRIARDLYAAAHHPERWPEAWQAFCDFFANMDTLSEKTPETPTPSSMMSQIDERAAWTHTGAAYDSKHRAFLPPIEIPLEARPALNVNTSCLSVLDVLPFPLFICDLQRHLLHANTAGQDELHRQTWLRLVHDRLVGATSPIELRLAVALCAGADVDRSLTLLRNGHADANLMFRQVMPDNGDGYWVLRLLHLTSHSDDDFTKLAMQLGLTPRQAELAQLLIGGSTLSDAARRMGIVRGSANDLLKRLFSITGTRRQQELVVYLNRRLASR